MKYYTYLHRRKDNGEVFYVGQGCNRRAFRSWHHDNKDWHKVADAVGHTVEILDKFATKKEALDAEYLLIQEYKDNGWLVNKIGGNVPPGSSYQAKNPRGRYNTKITGPTTLKAKGYTLLYDVWVKLHNYQDRLKKNPVTNCIEVYKGGLHSQGYMMISVVRDSDMKRMMVTGHRIAGRIKAKRALKEEEYVMDILLSYPIDIRIIGEEYRDKQFTGHELPMGIHFNSRKHSFSTTNLRKQVAEGEKKKNV